MIEDLFNTYPQHVWFDDAQSDDVLMQFVRLCGQQDPETNCVPWEGRTIRGTPVMKVGNRHAPAHQIALIITGQWPPPLEGNVHAYHTCCNSGCVNYKHIQWMTPVEYKVFLKTLEEVHG